MKNALLLSLLLLLNFQLIAQEFVYVATGASYNEQVFYQLSDDANVHITNDSWEIAFSFAGDSSGIFVNESIRTSFGNPQNSVIALDGGDATWDSVITPEDLEIQLSNDEKSWAWGAFNSMRDESDPNDYGWGQYSADEGGVIGNKIYVVRLRDGSYKKIEIQSLINKTYTFRYANLDGSEEENLVLSDDSFPDNHLICLSLVSGDFITEITDQPWDLMFLRYVSPIQGAPFSVSGILTDHGIQVAEARDLNPDDATYDVFQDFLESDSDVIGNDWKEFDNGWIIDDHLSFFVLLEGPRLWKLQFFEFQGSSTGGISFQKTNLTNLVHTTTPSSNLSNIALSPNPTSGSVDVIFSLKNKAQTINISLLNIQGKELKHYTPSTQLGMNVFRLNNLPNEKGVYFIKLQSGEDVLTQKLIIK